MAKKEATPEAAEVKEPVEAKEIEAVGEVADDKLEIEPDWVESLEEASLFDSPDASQQIVEKKAEEDAGTEDKVETKETDQKKAEEESSEEEIEGEDGVKRPRYAHFQREMQLAQNANKELTAKLEQSEKSKPIADFVLADKELQEAVDRRMKGLPLIKGSDELPEKPLSPVKPVGFSRQDAIDDPEGLSAAYLTEVEEYPVKLEAWRKADEDKRAGEAETTNREQAEIQFASDFKVAGRNAAVADGRIPSDKVNEVVDGFVNFYSNPVERSPQEAVDILFKAYLATLIPSKKKVETNHKVEEIKEKAKNKLPPPPSAAGNAETVVPTLSDEDYMKKMESGLLA